MPAENKKFCILFQNFKSPTKYDKFCIALRCIEGVRGSVPGPNVIIQYRFAAGRVHTQVFNDLHLHMAR